MTTRTRSLLAVSVVLVIGLVAVQLSAFRRQTPAAQTLPADLVLRNGRIVTVDDRLPEAQALAARDGGAKQEVAASANKPGE